MDTDEHRLFEGRICVYRCSSVVPMKESDEKAFGDCIDRRDGGVHYEDDTTDDEQLG